jgi:site-specific recombinase XerD
MRFVENKLTPYRRHQPPCESERPGQLDCDCPLWAHGRVKGKRFRRSLATRSLAQAKKKIQRLLDGTDEALALAEKAAAADSSSIAEEIEGYLGFCERNKRLRASTLVSYRDTLHAFRGFCDERLYRTVDQLSLKVFEMWQAERKVTPKSMHKEFTHLAGWCGRLIELGHMETNFAKAIKLPKADGVSTLPFKEAEAKAILAACTRLGETENQRGGYASYTADQIDDERRYGRALTLVLLTTGLRISDVVNLQRSRVYTDRNGKVRLRIRTEKTGVMVTLALPKATVQALNNLPRASDELYFWKGGDERQFATACDRARRVIARLGSIANVKNAHPHRFRDTWAKEALIAGTSMRTVQLVLGHKSIRTTEQHYAPFVPEYQNLIDAATDAVAGRLIA